MKIWGNKFLFEIESIIDQRNRPTNRVNVQTSQHSNTSRTRTARGRFENTEIKNDYIRHRTCKADDATSAPSICPSAIDTSSMSDVASCTEVDMFTSDRPVS